MRQRMEIAKNWPNTWLGWIRTVAVAPTRVTILCVVIVGPGLRVGILYLIARRSERMTMTIAKESHISCPKHNVICPGTSHHRLMVVIAHGIIVANEIKIGGIASTHVVIPHSEVVVLSL